MSIDDVDVESLKRPHYVLCSDKVTRILNVYFSPPISLIGMIANIICIITFYILLRSLKNAYEHQMYKYFFVKAICDFLPFLILAFHPVYYQFSNVEFASPYFMQIWYIYFKSYLSYILRLSSQLMEIMATFNCAISINKSMQWCNSRIVFFWANIIIFTYCSVFHLYIVFIFKICPVNETTTTVNLNETIVYHKHSQYYLCRSDFYNSTVATVFESIQTSMRDFLSLIVIVALNLWILIGLKKYRKKKEKEMNQKISIQIFRNKAQIVQRQKIKMIMFLCINYILGRIMVLVYYFSFDRTSSLWSCWLQVGSLLLYASYATPILIYTSCNDQFKAVLKDNKYYKCIASKLNCYSKTNNKIENNGVIGNNNNNNNEENEGEEMKRLRTFSIITVGAEMNYS
jgi:hypothetical protein